MIPKEKSNESVYWLYNSDDIESLLVHCDNYLRSNDKTKLTLQIVTSRFDLSDLFLSKKGKNLKFILNKKSEYLQYFSIERKIKNNEIIKGDFLLIKNKIPNVFFLLTHENSVFFKKGLIKMLDDYYPLISRMSMDSRYIYEILKKVNNSLGNNTIRVTKVVKKGWIKSEFAKKKTESDITWTDLSFVEVFQAIDESDEWIKSIDFTIIKKITKDFSNLNLQNGFLGYIDNYRISREGLFKCNQNFSQMYHLIIEEMAKKAAFNFELFDKRSRVKEEKYTPKPLVIQFDFDIFRDKNENKRLINVLNDISFSSLSVFHGNPYFNATYVDYRDGSSYGLWVLSDESITIVPQMRSSPASLDRLCESIFTGFREGMIKEFEAEYG